MRRARQRMELEAVAVLVRANRADNARIDIDGGGHAAWSTLSTTAPGANADKRIDDALLFFAQERSDAQRVHGRGADGRKRLMLLHAFFQQRNAVGLERFQRRNLLGMVFYDAKAARTVDWLADDVARALRFPFFPAPLRWRCAGQIHARWMYLEKSRLNSALSSRSAERFFIHARDNAVGQRPRDHRLPLRGGEAVHLGNFVVHITGAYRTAQRSISKSSQARLLPVFLCSSPAVFHIRFQSILRARCHRNLKRDIQFPPLAKVSPRRMRRMRFLLIKIE